MSLDLLCELIQRHGSAEVKALGGSMRPYLHDGDLIGIERAGAHDVQPADIVAFVGSGEEGPTLIVHRVIEMDPGSGEILTKGDALRVYDPALSPAHLLGTVTYARRGARTLRLGRSAANPALRLYLWLAARWARRHPAQASPGMVEPIGGLSQRVARAAIRWAWRLDRFSGR